MDRWDLHIHTTWSDGSTSPVDAVRFAAEQNLSGIAITDHDAVEMVQVAQKEGEKLGVEVIPGVEISTIDSSNGRRVHLLVYYPLDTAVLQPVFEKTAENRMAAGKKMAQLLSEKYPITVDMAIEAAKNSKTIFKTHLMRLLLDRGYSDKMYSELYFELLGDKGSCFQPIASPDTIETAKIARKSGGVVVLAHPDVYDSFEIGEKLASMGLIDGVELYYPRKKAEHEELHRSLIERYDLITTGGTDYHGFYTPRPCHIGTSTVGEKEISALKSLSQKKRMEFK
ncbi:MAG: PHP domain-containing protein [Oscillospiraceae bacterium]|nr:PHP domain-containing protein [Oscillospiraceae bacterium]